MSDLTVRLGGITFRGFDDGDEYGFWIGENGWSGWDVPPAQRADIVARATTHGTFDALQLFEAREVAQSGFFRARTAQELAHMAEALSGSLDGVERTLVVESGGVTRRARFKRGLSAPAIKLTSVGDLHVGEYDIVHRMRDPRKYGETLEYTAGVQAVHRGNFPADPAFIVSGAAPSGYTITGPGGRRVVVVKPLTAGSPHRIEFAEPGLSIGGVRQLAAFSVFEPWTIPPGNAGVVHSISGGLTLRILVPTTSV